MKIPAKIPLKTASAAMLLALTAALSIAQTTVHHTRSTKAEPATCPPGLAAPVVPANVPAAPGPIQTAFALRYIDVQPGTGETVTPGEFLTVHYTGWLLSDGTKFDSSVDRGQPFTFRQGIHQVISGWDQGFEGMRVGGKRRLFIPYQMAYGEQGHPPLIPAKGDLIFDIELIAASATPPGEPPAPPAPAQQATPPS